MKNITGIGITVLILAASPAWGATWEEDRDMLLGPGRHVLMESCALGRKYNNRGESYWDPDLVKRVTLGLKKSKSGWSDAEIESYFAGLTAAMSQVCPNVW